MTKTHPLSPSRKLIIRERLIAGARSYKKQLMDKHFYIVCEDGTGYEISFFKNDFKHLTGIDTNNLSATDFFNECFKGHISENNIRNDQKYDWNTLKHKTKSIKMLPSLLYQDSDKTLLIDTLTTNTYTFPIAVKDVGSNICVGFSTTLNRARSLRKASGSTNPAPGAEKKIIAIFGKPSNEILYNELVYISDIKNVYRQCPNLFLSSLSPDLKDRFSYVISYN